VTYRTDLIIRDAEEILPYIKANTHEGRTIIRQLLHIIETAEAESDDYADILSDLDLMRRQYANYPPMPLDDDDYDSDEEFE
jgi:hypothetical protein